MTNHFNLYLNPELVEEKDISVSGTLGEGFFLDIKRFMVPDISNSKRLPPRRENAPTFLWISTYI